MKKITIYPSEGLKEKIEDLAKKEDRSVNYLIIKILNKFFKIDHGNQHPKKRTHRIEFKD